VIGVQERIPNTSAGNWFQCLWIMEQRYMAPLICAHLHLFDANDTERPITVTNGKCGQGGSRRLGIEMFNLSDREIVITLKGGKLEDGTGLTRDIRKGRGITRNEYNPLYFSTKFPTHTCSVSLVMEKH